MLMYLNSHWSTVPDQRLSRPAHPGRTGGRVAAGFVLLMVLSLPAGANSADPPATDAVSGSPPSLSDSADKRPGETGVSSDAEPGAEPNDEAAFFANLSKQPGVIDLGSGAYARELAAGQAPAVPNAELVVVNLASRPLHAAALGADGQVTEHERRAQRYVVGQLPGALQAAVQRMQVGARWEVLVPHQGGRKAKRGKKEKVLPATVFTLELISAH